MTLQISKTHDFPCLMLGVKLVKFFHKDQSGVVTLAGVGKIGLLACWVFGEISFYVTL
jgi:hypothetical protein